MLTNLTPVTQLDELLNPSPMTRLEEIPLLKIDDNTISLAQGLQYLLISEEMPRFLLEITKHYLIEREMQQQGIEANNVEIIEQFILEFRLQQQLTTLDKFHEWLAAQGMTYGQFRDKIAFVTCLEALKKRVIEPQIIPYFQEKQGELTRFLLSRLVVDKEELALSLKEQIEQSPDSFATVAKQYSIVDDAIIGGLMGAVSRQDMPEIIAQVTANAQAGDILGPLAVEERFCLLKVEQILPAELDSQMQKQIENQLFEQWLKERLEQANISLVLSTI